MSVNELLAFSKGAQDKKKKFAVQDFLQNSIEEFFWSLNNNKHYEEDTYGGEIERGFHPSALAGASCKRKLIFQYFEIPEEDAGIEPKLRRIFDNGHGCHERWQTYFTLLSHINKDIVLIGSWKCKGCGLVISADKAIPEPENFECPRCKSKRIKYNEYRVRDKKLRITGKFDIKLLIKGKEYLIEIKSINMFSYQKLFHPLPDHIKQFSFYQKLDGTPIGFFLYEDKNTQDYRIFQNKFDPEDIADEMALLLEVNSMLDSNVVPDRLPLFPSCKECKTCGQKNTCKKDWTIKMLEDDFNGRHATPGSTGSGSKRSNSKKAGQTREKK
jgi:hypothetical protein